MDKKVESNPNPVFRDPDDKLWYFWNETWTHKHGSYESEKTAKDAMDQYCLCLYYEELCMELRAVPGKDQMLRKAADTIEMFALEGERLHAELSAIKLPSGIYRGACGHYWDSAIYSEDCPHCSDEIVTSPKDLVLKLCDKLETYLVAEAQVDFDREFFDDLATIRASLGDK